MWKKIRIGDIMGRGKHHTGRPEAASPSADTIRCDVCGRDRDPAQVVWDEDDAVWICETCVAENESCGCSDTTCDDDGCSLSRGRG
jgi:hypothetical protein